MRYQIEFYDDKGRMRAIYALAGRTKAEAEAKITRQDRKNYATITVKGVK